MNLTYQHSNVAFSYLDSIEKVYVLAVYVFKTLFSLHGTKIGKICSFYNSQWFHNLYKASTFLSQQEDKLWNSNSPHILGVLLNTVELHKFEDHRW